MPERKGSVIAEMSKQYAPQEYEIVPAIENKKDPIKGLSDTIKKIITDNYDKPFIHIFEDDIRFTSDRSREVFEDNFEALPDNWDIYLGGAYSKQSCYGDKFGYKWGKYPNGVKAEYGIIGMRTFSSLHCAVIRKSIYGLILDHDSSHLDFYLSKNIMNGSGPNWAGVNVYLCNPTIALQYPGYSFLSKQKVDYSHFEQGMNILR
jgi:GR25 family glycosyltransferase involved in LPS biosynthesis